MIVCHLKKFRLFVLLKSLIVAGMKSLSENDRLMSSDCIPMMSKGDLSKWYFYKLITTQNSPRNFHWTNLYAEQLEQRGLFLFSLFNVCIFVAASKKVTDFLRAYLSRVYSRIYIPHTICLFFFLGYPPNPFRMIDKICFVFVNDTSTFDMENKNPSTGNIVGRSTECYVFSLFITPKEIPRRLFSWTRSFIGNSIVEL